MPRVATASRRALVSAHAPYTPYTGDLSYGHNVTLSGSVQVHDCKRPHICRWPGCNKSFAQKSNMQIHYRVHTGEKPFRCAECPGRFSAGSGLLHHRERFHGYLRTPRTRVQASGPNVEFPPPTMPLPPVSANVVAVDWNVLNFLVSSLSCASPTSSDFSVDSGYASMPYTPEFTPLSDHELATVPCYPSPTPDVFPTSSSTEELHQFPASNSSSSIKEEILSPSSSSFSSEIQSINTFSSFDNAFTTPSTTFDYLGPSSSSHALDSSNYYGDATSTPSPVSEIEYYLPIPEPELEYPPVTESMHPWLPSSSAEMDCSSSDSDF